MGSLADAASMATGAEQDLCKACGLCCTGAWFPHINLQSEEVSAARHAGLKVEIVDGQARAPQPCALHDGSQCTGYASWRPNSCGSYRCLILDDLAQERLTFYAALSHVVAAKGMADRIRAEIGNMKGGLLGRAFLLRIDEGGASSSSSAKLDAVALNMYYAKHFRRPIDEDL